MSTPEGCRDAAGTPSQAGAGESRKSRRTVGRPLCHSRRSGQFFAPTMIIRPQATNPPEIVAELCFSVDRPLEKCNSGGVSLEAIMRNLLTIIVASLVAIASLPGAALAQSRSSCSIWRPWNCFSSGGGSTSGSGTTTPAAVPEIDASAGLLAVAALAIVLLFVWERRRRAA